MGRGDATLVYNKDGHEFALIARHSLRGGDRSHGSVQLDYGFRSPTCCAACAGVRWLRRKHDRLQPQGNLHRCGRVVAGVVLSTPSTGCAHCHVGAVGVRYVLLQLCEPDAPCALPATFLDRSGSGQWCCSCSRQALLPMIAGITGGASCDGVDRQTVPSRSNRRPACAHVGLSSYATMLQDTLPADQGILLWPRPACARLKRRKSPPCRPARCSTHRPRAHCRRAMVRATQVRTPRASGRRYA